MLAGQTPVRNKQIELGKICQKVKRFSARPAEVTAHRFLGRVDARTVGVAVSCEPLG
jgi:hypothetical protein